MSEPPFKYSISFPDREKLSGEEDEGNSFEIIDRGDGEDCTPVVVLLGWAGSSDRHLAKYCTIYEKEGYITLRVIAPTSVLFVQTYKLHDIAKGLMDVIIKANIGDNPIIFHIFSNGGSLMYTSLSALLNTPESPYHRCLSVRGIIIDSAPGKTRVFNAVRAFMSTISSRFMRYILGLFFLVYLLLNRLANLLLPMETVLSKGFQVYDKMCLDKNRCPQLFLYSKADSVIMAHDVEEVISRRRDQGVDVKSLCFESSAHVAHYRTSPELYAKTCLEFVSDCLKKTKTYPSPPTGWSKM